MAIETEPVDLQHLDEAIEKVEFKLTVLTRDEPRVQALFGAKLVPPERRKVYFYDTRDLALDAKHLVLRSRVIQGDDDDSTVKLRPADLSGAGDAWRRIDGITVELDVVGTDHRTSAKLEGEPEPGEIEDVEAERRPVASLFSAEQKALVNAFASDVSLDDLAVLGPVDARKWELANLQRFPYELCIEEWSLPDTSRFIELSCKVRRREAADAQAAFRSLLDRSEIDPAGDQVAKTPRVLEFFAERL